MSAKTFRRNNFVFAWSSLIPDPRVVWTNRWHCCPEYCPHLIVSFFWHKYERGCLIRRVRRNRTFIWPRRFSACVYVYIYIVYFFFFVKSQVRKPVVGGEWVEKVNGLTSPSETNIYEDDSKNTKCYVRGALIYSRRYELSARFPRAHASSAFVI